MDLHDFLNENRIITLNGAWISRYSRQTLKGLEADALKTYQKYIQHRDDPAALDPEMTPIQMAEFLQATAAELLETSTYLLELLSKSPEQREAEQTDARLKLLRLREARIQARIRQFEALDWIKEGDKFSQERLKMLEADLEKVNEQIAKLL